MTLFTPMRALTVVIECCLDALATILDPGPGVSDEYLRAAVGADELAEDEAEDEVRAPRPPGAWNYGSTFGGPLKRDIKWSVNTEPPLTGSELVAIRQLLEEHSNFTTPCADGVAGDPGPAAQDGPAPGNSTGKVTPGAGQPDLRSRVRRAVTSHIGNSFGSGDEIADDIYYELTEGDAGLLTGEDLINAAWAVRWAAESRFAFDGMANAWAALAARLEATAASTPN